MIYSLLADITVILHLVFILFVVLGGLTVLKWRWMAWVHIPAAIWGALIEFMGWICPLTPLENQLRRLADESGYTGDFTEQYLVPLIYPGELTREIQLLLGAGVIFINVVIYFFVIRLVLRKKQ